MSVHVCVHTDTVCVFGDGAVPLYLHMYIHSDTVCVFGDGEVPVWVYAELAQPLTMLLGVTGYEQMVTQQYTLHAKTSRLITKLSIYMDKYMHA